MWIFQFFLFIFISDIKKILLFIMKQTNQTMEQISQKIFIANL